LIHEFPSLFSDNLSQTNWCDDAESTPTDFKDNSQNA